MMLTLADDGLRLMVTEVVTQYDHNYAPLLLVRFLRPDGSRVDHPFMISKPGFVGYYEQARAKECMVTVLSGVGLTIEWLTVDGPPALRQVVGVQVDVTVRQVVRKDGTPRVDKFGRPTQEVRFLPVEQDIRQSVLVRSTLRVEEVYTSWDVTARALVMHGVDPDYVAEVMVAWDRDCPDVALRSITFWQFDTGQRLLWVRRDTPYNPHVRCFDWCHHHRRWERCDVNTRDIACHTGW